MTSFCTFSLALLLLLALAFQFLWAQLLQAVPWRFQCPATLPQGTQSINSFRSRSLLLNACLARHPLSSPNTTLKLARGKVLFSCPLHMFLTSFTSGTPIPITRFTLPRCLLSFLPTIHAVVLRVVGTLLVVHLREGGLLRQWTGYGSEGGLLLQRASSS